MNISQRIKSMLPFQEVKSLAELERACGISNGTIGKWGTGAYKPTTRSLEKVAAFFDVSTDYLLGNTDDPTPADKKNAPSEPMSSKEALKQFLVKEGVLPADRDITDEEARTLAAMADAFFRKGKK